MYKRKPPHFIPPILNHKDERHSSIPPSPPLSLVSNATISPSSFTPNLMYPSFPGMTTNANELKMYPASFGTPFHSSHLVFHPELVLSSPAPTSYSHVDDIYAGLNERENTILMEPQHHTSLHPPPPFSLLPPPSTPIPTTTTNTPFTKATPSSAVYSSLKKMTQVQKLPQSLGPPGDYETELRRIKMQQAKLYSNQLRYQWKRTWERRVQQQHQKQKLQQQQQR